MQTGVRVNHQVSSRESEVKKCKLLREVGFCITQLRWNSFSKGEMISGPKALVFYSQKEKKTKINMGDKRRRQKFVWEPNSIFLEMGLCNRFLGLNMFIIGCKDKNSSPNELKNSETALFDQLAPTVISKQKISLQYRLKTTQYLIECGRNTNLHLHEITDTSLITFKHISASQIKFYYNSTNQSDSSR